MQLIAMAWRNIFRNKRRTIITTIAIGIGLALLIISSSLGDGTHNLQIKTGVSQMAGHVVVQAKGYQAEKDVEIAIEGAAAITQTLKSTFPEATVIERIFFDGLLTSSMGSSGVGITAIDPDDEAKVGDFDEKIVEGTYLDGTPGKAVIGVSLAETLDVGVGDKIVLMSQRGSEVENTLFRVQGLFRTGAAELDGFFMQIPLEDAQSLLGLEDGVSQISLHLESAEDTPAALAMAKAALPGSELEILSWQQALPELYQYIVFDNAGLYVFILIIAFIVALGILNTQLMSVLERVREFGVMLALGMSPRRLGALILTEAFLLGLLGVGAGVALGLLGNWPLTVSGLDYSEMIGETVEAGGVAISSHIYGDLSPEKVVYFALMALGLTVVASIYPVAKAANLEPREAMHHT